jgi:hypothetical protein
MAWSPATGRCVLYGGQAFGSTTGDTWDWDGTTWQQRAASAGVRSGHRLAFDPVRNVVTMVAGYRQDGPAFDAWDWNGTSWTRLEGAAPQVSLGGNLFGHAACHDPVRGETVAVGGVEQGTSRFQTWVWNGSGWVQRSPTNAPPFRFDPMLCFDAVRAQVLLFGGENAGDFWTWDGTDWTPAPPGPPARSGGGFAFDHARGVAVLFGGFEHSGFTALDDTWEWNGTTWTQRTFAVRPSPRRWPAFGFDPATQALVLNGFLAGPADTWRYDGTQWTALAPATSPTTAIGQRQLLTDFHRGRLLLVGGVGFGPATQPYQIWEWDGATWTQRLSLLSMGKRSVFDDNRGRIVNLDGPVHELVIPVDVAGSGNAPLVALDRPVLGAPFRLDLGAPLGVFAWTFANVATPPTILSGGVFCGNEPYYLDANATIGLEAGPILTIVLPPIPVLTQLPLMVQQAVFDPSGCRRTSDALAIRVQSP